MVRPANPISAESWQLISKALDWEAESVGRPPAADSDLDLRKRRKRSLPAELDAWPLGPCTYFIGGAEGPIKIGFSTNVAKRLETIQISSPVPLRIYAVHMGPRVHEGGYHSRFKADRLHGEWYARTPALMAVIADLIGNAVQTVRESAGIPKRFR